MRCALLSLALLPACSGFVTTTWKDLEANPAYSFDDYKAEFGKTYGSAAEHAAKKAQFETNLAKIRAHNGGAHSWKMGLNHLTDVDMFDKTAMQPFTGKVLRNKGRFVGASQATADDLRGDAPDTLDWRSSGAVTPVKNQGGCGSCWAFSSAESLESNLFIETGTMLTLSPQELVSCVPNPHHCGGVGGCQGATEELGFAYAVANGSSLEASYPYTQRTGTCTAAKIAPKAGFKGYKQLPANDGAALMQALANVGPVSISLDASFGPYESGVFTGSSSCWDIDHAVQAVGYGTDAEHGDFWLVRNSWGASWGEAGYIRIARQPAGEEPCFTDKTPGDGNGCDGAQPMEVCGVCGMLSDSSYPFGGYLIQ